MNTHMLLGNVSRLLPESKTKTLLRRVSYSILRQIRWGIEEIRFNGVSFRMYKYPFLGGTGFENTALAGYVMRRDVHHGDIVIDAGAYAGDFALYASIKTGPAGRVIAFEPDPTSISLLESNIKLNGLTNILVARKGLWKHDGDMFITGTAFASELTTDRSRYSLRVPVCSLDSELQRLNVSSVSFIKMDIEGAEIEALAGMKRIMHGKPYLAIASYHIRNGATTSNEITSILRRLGYTVTSDNAEHLTTFAE